jgi:hypothetical protein
MKPLENKLVAVLNEKNNSRRRDERPRSHEHWIGSQDRS